MMGATKSEPQLAQQDGNERKTLAPNVHGAVRELISFETHIGEEVYMMLAYLAPLTRELFIFVIIADFKAHSNDKEQVRLIASRLAGGYPPGHKTRKLTGRGTRRC